MLECVKKLINDFKQRIMIPPENLLFIGLVFVILIPLFFFKYFPNWDGPAHVGGAAIFHHYNDLDRSAFREFFLVNPRPSPNLFGHALLVLFQIFVSPVWSEKLLVMLVFVSLPIAFRYLIVQLNVNARHLTYFVFPLTIGWFVYAGQYNFSLSISAFFLALGYWFQKKAEVRFQHILVLSFLLSILYFSHIVSYVMFFVFTFCTIQWESIARRFIGDMPVEESLSEIARNLLPLLTASVPSATLAVVYFSTGSLVGFGDRQPLFDLIKAFATLSSVLIVFDKAEYMFSIFVNISVIALFLVVFRNPRARNLKLPQIGFLLVFFVIFALYFLLPDALAGGSFLSSRLCLFAYIALVCWLAQFDFVSFMQRLIIASLVFATLGLTIIRLPIFIAFNRDITEFMSAAPLLRENATVLPLFYIYDGYHGNEEDQNGITAYARRTRPMDFITGYLMAEQGVVDLAHYESGYDYFPTRFRAELDPTRYLGTATYWMESIPPAVNIENYFRTTSGRVDFVLVWGLNHATEEVLSDTKTLLIQRQLAMYYELIHTSEPRGLLQVYQRNSVQPP
jgi:hypothetical protein